MGGGGMGGGGRGGGPPPPDLYDGEEAKDVVKLGGANFKATVGRAARGNTVIILEFYSPGCGHCRNLAPTLATLATSLRGIVTVGVVNCETQRRVCESYDVNSYPTIKILHAGGAGDYHGPHLGGALRAAAVRYVVSRVASLAGSGASAAARADSFLRRCGWPAAGTAAVATTGPASRSTGGCVLLFTDKSESPPLFSALSSAREWDARGEGSATTAPAFHFATVTLAGSDDVGASALAAALGVTSTPALVVVHGDSLSAIRDGGVLRPVDAFSRAAAARVIPGDAYSLPAGYVPYTGGALAWRELKAFLTAHQRAITPMWKAARAAAPLPAGAGAATSGSQDGSAPSRPPPRDGLEPVPATAADVLPKPLLLAFLRELIENLQQFKVRVPLCGWRRHTQSHTHTTDAPLTNCRMRWPPACLQTSHRSQRRLRASRMATSRA